MDNSTCESIQNSCDHYPSGKSLGSVATEGSCIAAAQSLSCRSSNNDRLNSITENVELDYTPYINCMFFKFVVLRNQRLKAM